MCQQLRISDRAGRVIASPIRKFFPLALAAERQGVTALKVNVGDSDIPAPAAFLLALKNYPGTGLNYAPSTGLRKHALAWVKYFASFGVTLQPEQIIPTVGCAEAMLFVLMAVADPGDEILVFEPLYSSYKGFAAMLNIRLVPVTLRVENNFSLPLEKEICKKITRRTKALVVINPNNPTGTVLTARERAMVGRIARKHHLFVIVDETYREIIFFGPPSTFLNLPGLREHVIVIDSVSKKFSCPGARVGCVASFNPAVMSAMLRFAMVRLSVGTLEQHSLVPLLSRAKTFSGKITREYKKRRDVVYAALKKIPGVVCHKPHGALYLIAKLPLDDAEKFVKFLLTEFRWHGTTVLVTPAHDFYLTPGLGRNEIRIAYVLNVRLLQKAMVILQHGLRAYQKKYAA